MCILIKEKTMTPEEIDRIVALRDNGSTFDEISNIVGYSAGYVGKVYTGAKTRFKPNDEFDNFYYAIFKKHFPEVNDERF